MAALTVVMTWPQAYRMTTHVNDRGDPLLNAWAMAWVAHQLPRDPRHLFDANIFYPERATLAYSESLVLPALIVAPLRWVGVHPIVTYNLVMLFGFAGSGVAMFLLVRRLTGSRAAALVAAVAFAFLPFRFDHYPQVQLQQSIWMPLALWGLHRTLASGRIGDGVLTGVAVAAQAWSCLYYAIFFAPYLAIVGGVLVAASLPRVKRDPTGVGRTAVALAAGALVAILLSAPLIPAYSASRAVVGERVVAEIGGASLDDYLAAPPSNRIYGGTTARFGGAERYLFPGFLVLLLALVGLWPPWSAARLAYAIGLLLAFDLSRGSAGLTHGILFDVFPPFRAVRAVSRMGLLTAMTLTVLAGMGMATILRLLRARTKDDERGAGRRGVSRERLVATIAIAVVLVESASAPLELQRVPRNPPAVARWLATIPRASVLELPIGVQDTLLMYFSIWHWQPIANGYSGFFPQSYTQLRQALESFPDSASIDAVRRRCIQLIVLHENLMRDGVYRRMTEALAQRRDVRLVGAYGYRGTEASVYEVIRDP
jgi:hypothetical protein